MLLNKKTKSPNEPWDLKKVKIDVVSLKDCDSVKKAYDHYYSQQLDILKWNLKHKDLNNNEFDEIQIRIGELRKFQKENGFGPWYHENDLHERIK
ncbi:MAG: hypothetical protein PVH26_07515 [Desulfosarcina sp.]|jgi:hypothetical protein